MEHYLLIILQMESAKGVRCGQSSGPWQSPPAHRSKRQLVQVLEARGVNSSIKKSEARQSRRGGMKVVMAVLQGCKHPCQNHATTTEVVAPETPTSPLLVGPMCIKKLEIGGRQGRIIKHLGSEVLLRADSRQSGPKRDLPMVQVYHGIEGLLR